MYLYKIKSDTRKDVFEVKKSTIDMAKNKNMSTIEIVKNSY